MKVTGETIARTVILALALINQVLTMCGVNPLPFIDNQVYEFITLAFTLGASLWAWWKNNSFTKNAIKADEYLTELKED